MADLRLRRYSNTAPDMTLTAALSNVTTTVTVNTATGLPSVPFTIECENEVMLVTNVTGTTLTVIRGYDGTTPVAHPDSTLVQHVLTADDFEHRWQDVNVTRPYAPLDDEFDDLTKDPAYIETNPAGTATWTESNGVMSTKFSGQAAADCSILVKPATAIGISSALQVSMRAFSHNNYAMFGPVFTSGFTTTSNVVWQMAYIAGDNADSMNFSLRSGTVTNVGTTHYTVSGAVAPLSGWLHMRLAWVTVNTYKAWWSIDGVSFSDLGQTAFTISSVSPPAYMGIGVSAWGGTGDKLATAEYLRVVTL